jgi:hypothetical protein
MEKYKIHGETIFIKSNGIIGHYMVNGNEVDKVMTHSNGDDYLSKFHTLGELPLNTEAKLLNKLRKEGKI